MCETKGYPKQNIVALMAKDFEAKNLPKKKVVMRQIDQAFGGKGVGRKKK